MEHLVWGVHQKGTIFAYCLLQLAFQIPLQETHTKIKRIKRYHETALISGNDDGSLRFWDVNTGKNIETWKEHNASITGVQVVTEGSVVSSDVTGKVRIWHNGISVKTLDNEFSVNKLLIM